MGRKSEGQREGGERGEREGGERGGGGRERERELSSSVSSRSQ